MLRLLFVHLLLVFPMALNAQNSTNADVAAFNQILADINIRQATITGGGTIVQRNPMNFNKIKRYDILETKIQRLSNKKTTVSNKKKRKI
ncbi:MAG: hypothetical protein HRT72_11510, partial [Flavobacteriales bacterium]|nr:hypothetical protein [Flavobacteriales bacterium]